MNALTVNNTQNNDYYNLFIKWFPADKNRIDNIYKKGATDPDVAAIELHEYLGEKIVNYSKKSSQKKYAMAAETLKQIRENIIVPENPWKVCFDALWQTGKRMMEFTVKKGMIKVALTAANKVLEYTTGLSVPEPILDKVATGITVVGKHLIKPLKIIANKTKEAVKKITGKAVEKVSSFVVKAADGLITGTRKVISAIKTGTTIIRNVAREFLLRHLFHF